MTGLLQDLRRDFLVDTNALVETFFYDIASIIVFVIIGKLVKAMSAGITNNLVGIVQSGNQALIASNASIIYRAMWYSLSLAALTLIAYFLLFSFSRHLVWRRLRGKKELKELIRGWGKTILGILSFGVIVLIVMSFPMAVAYGSMVSGLQPNLLIIILMGIFMLLLWHLYINYIFQLTRTGKVFHSYALAFKRGFGGILGFLPRYLLLFIILVLISLIPLLLSVSLDPASLAGKIISEFLMLIWIVYSRSVLQSHMAHEEKRARQTG